MKGYRCVAWGDNEHGQCDVPEGERFIQIDANMFGSVGLRVDGSAVLWGGVKKDDPLREPCAQFPEGEFFKQVSLGENGTAYGLRHDGSVLAVETSVYERTYQRFVGPVVDGVKILSDFSIDEKFVQIASGADHFVGLREDGTVLTWHNLGEDEEIQEKLNIPGHEKFKQVACGDSHTVGLRTDGTIGCWGAVDPEAGVPDFSEDGYGPPVGDGYQGVAAGGSFSIGIDYKGNVIPFPCWPLVSNNRKFPGGTFYQVAVGSYHCVGIRMDGTVVCWGCRDSGTLDAPDGVFKRVAVGGFHSLGLVVD